MCTSKSSCTQDLCTPSSDFRKKTYTSKNHPFLVLSMTILDLRKLRVQLQQSLRLWSPYIRFRLWKIYKSKIILDVSQCPVHISAKGAPLLPAPPPPEKKALIRSKSFYVQSRFLQSVGTKSHHSFVSLCLRFMQPQMYISKSPHVVISLNVHFRLTQ